MKLLTQHWVKRDRVIYSQPIGLRIWPKIWLNILTQQGVKTTHADELMGYQVISIAVVENNINFLRMLHLISLTSVDCNLIEITIK